MKTSTLLSIVSILALSAGTSIAADNYLVGTGWGGGGMAGNWSTGASPTISDDIFIDYKYYFEAKAPEDTGNWGVSVYVYEGFANSKVNSMTIQNLYNPDTLTSETLRMQVSSTATACFDIKNDLTAVGDTYNSKAYLMIGKADVDSKILVGKDFNVGVSTFQKGEGIHVYIGGTGSEKTSGTGGPSLVTVGGNLNIYGASKLMSNIGTSTQSGSTANLQVAGVVNMVGAGGTDNPTWYLNSRNSGSDVLNTVLQIGGLNGTGLIRNATSTLGGSSTVIFKNAAGTTSKYIGIFKDDVTIGSISTVAVSMDGEGTQILTNVNISGPSEVKNGTLLAAGNFQFLNVSANGKFGAEIETSAIGSVNVAYLNFDSGATLLFDIDGANCDIVKATEFILGAASDIMNIDVNAGNIISGNAYKIFECGTLSGGFTENNFKVNDIDGYDSQISIVGNDVYLTLNAVVPEPATYAAIFGALALAAAIRRGRK